MSSELLRAMKDAGCDRIHYGVECGNNRMLKVIKKNTTVEKVEEVINWTKDVDMEVLTYFMIGQQTETAEDFQDTIDLAKRLDPNYVHFTIFCPYPATETYFEGLKNGVIKRDVWKEFAANPTEGFDIPFWEELYTADELRGWLVKAYKEFYLRPSYIIKNVSKIRSWGELRRKVRAGLSVVTLGSTKEDLQTLAIKKKVHDIVPLASYDVHA